MTVMYYTLTQQKVWMSDLESKAGINLRTVGDRARCKGAHCGSADKT